MFTSEEEFLGYMIANRFVYERLEHPAVFTCEEADRYHAGIEAVHTKNLFLCDKKKRHFFLVVTACEKTVRLDKLAVRLGVSHLRFASAENLEKFLGVRKEQREAHSEIETKHPGYLGAQDTYYVGTIKGIGRIYQQTFIDTYTKVGFAKLYTSKHAITAADLLNDRVLPWYEEQSVRLLRILTDRGTEYNGSIENHEYQLYLAIEDIDHSKTKARHPQGICERFHRTIKEEFYDIAFRKKIYKSLDELQADLDQWIDTLFPKEVAPQDSSSVTVAA